MPKRASYETQVEVDTHNAKVDRLQDAAMALVMADNMEGICLKCEEVQGGCEPDARKYKCESCGKMAVYGAEEVLFLTVG